MFLKKYSQLSLDSRQVQAAATLLNVTEFRLFELAHLEWFGSSGQEGELERIYMLYWFTGLAPVWVRHYSRYIISLGRQIGHEAGLSQTLPGLSMFQVVTVGCLVMSVLLLMAVI